MQRHRFVVRGYTAPGSVDEAVALLAAHDGRARLIAGGTDLLLEMQRGARPGVDVLIDVSRLPGFRSIRHEGDRIVVAGGVTHADAVASPHVVEHGLPLAQACLEVGAPQLRNRATIAGNLVTASPANDTISALMALDAEVVLVSEAGTRTVPLDGFYTGLRETVMGAGEMVTEVRFPADVPGRRGIFVKLGLRRAQAISVVHVACALDFDGDVVTGARLALGSVAPTVVLATRAAACLVGRTLSDEAIAEAARLAAAACTPIDDIRATARYRLQTASVMVRRALRILREGRERERWPVRPVTLRAAIPDRSGQGGGTEHADGVPVEATVNGTTVVTTGRVSKTVLDWLRDDAGPALGTPLTGTKEGCAEGECGACTVFMDGEAVLACLVPAARAHGASITTVEGLGHGALHPLQEAFIEHGAVQCGFCTPGFLMAGAMLLDEVGAPGLDEMRAGLAGCLCRCTGYYKIIDAVTAAGSGR